jgi:hypothetical protein
MKGIFIWLSVLITAFLPIYAQELVLETNQFFAKDTPVAVTLNTNLKLLNSNRKNTPYQSGTITWHNPAGTGDITESVKLSLRGNFRKENCAMASLMIDFKDAEKKSTFRKLGKVKMVGPCGSGYEYEQYVLKEFLIYKMYNLLTDESFKVRLLNVTIQDSIKAKRNFRHYAFLIEPTKVLAKRLNWVEEENKKYNTEQTDRANATRIFLFQYMVGNTDWAIPIYHNVKLFFPKDTIKSRPFMVPYDFDFSGLVNTPYASQPPTTGLTLVTERFYMGYPRTIEELKVAADLFLAREKEIKELVKKFEYIGNNQRSHMTEFLEEFFELIKNENQMKVAFIDNALRARR